MPVDPATRSTEYKTHRKKAMDYILDTNVWLRLHHFPEEINNTVLDILRAESQVALSSVSLLEVAQKNASKKGPILRIPIRQWFSIALPKQIRVFDLSPDVAAAAYELGEDFHGDPADRIIAATSIVHRLTLVTSDKRLIEHPTLNTLSTR